MQDYITQVFETFRPWLDAKGYTPDRIQAANAVLRQMPLPMAVAQPAKVLTPRILLEIVHHEAIILEYYKDSVGVGTWGPGITSRSGHNVERYKDKPQTLARVLEVFLWLLETKYLPDVLEEFKGHDLTEAQLAAALSFHWNTGAIKKADWVDQVLLGNRDAGERTIMNWTKPIALKARREAERDLFFHGVWAQDGSVTVYDVAKPSYTPKWKSARKVDIRADVAALLA